MSKTTTNYAENFKSPGFRPEELESEMELYQSHNAKALNLEGGSFLSDSEGDLKKEKQATSGLIKIVHSNATNSPRRELKSFNNNFDLN
jgi:hypothetical protein